MIVQLRLLKDTVYDNIHLRAIKDGTYASPETPNPAVIWMDTLPQVGHRIDLDGDDYEVVSVMWNRSGTEFVAASDTRPMLRVPAYAPTITLR